MLDGDSGKPDEHPALTQPYAVGFPDLDAAQLEPEAVAVALPTTDLDHLQRFSVVASRVTSRDGRPVEASILVKGGHLHELHYRQTVDQEDDR